MSLGEGALGESIHRKHQHENPEFDITAMVDLVFMMNIYFLVTFVTVALSGFELPSASHCLPLDADSAVVFTLLRSGRGEPVMVYLGDPEKGEPLTNVENLEGRIHAAVEQGVAEGRTAVLLKAGKDVRLGDVNRVATAATQLEGVSLHVAVTERESAP